MLHPAIAKGIRFLLIVSGCIFASLMAMTVAGLVLIELNGGSSMNWYLEQVLGLVLLAVIFIAVVWEVTHLFEWSSFLSEDPAKYLREHARAYTEWMFGWSP